MKVEIKQCKDKHDYTLKQSCSSCQEKTQTIKPAKYSPEDKYGAYRRQAKREVGEL